MDKDMEYLETRVSALERWRNTIDVSLGKHEVDKEYINRRFDALETELKEIKATAKQLTYAVASAVIIYIVTFIMNGGLAAIKGA